MNTESSMFFLYQTENITTPRNSWTCSIQQVFFRFNTILGRFLSMGRRPHTIDVYLHLVSQLIALFACLVAKPFTLICCPSKCTKYEVTNHPPPHTSPSGQLQFHRVYLSWETYCSRIVMVIHLVVYTVSAFLSQWNMNTIKGQLIPSKTVRGLLYMVHGLSVSLRSHWYFLNLHSP